MARKSKAAFERNKEYCKEYYAKHSKFVYGLVQDWRRRHPEIVMVYRAKNLIWTMCEVIFEKIRLLDAYGGACECCGERTYEFMSLDHIYGDGHKERILGMGTALYKRLRRLGYPKDRYRLLCHNCNFSKGKYGYCPHEIRQCAEYGMSGC